MEPLLRPLGEPSFDLIESPDDADAWRDVLDWMVASETYLAQLRSSLGLSAHEMSLLLALRADGTCAISDVAARIQLSRPAVTNMVQRLHADGWVSRSGHDTDRRKVMLTATDRFDHELAEHSIVWRHRLRNLASASDHWHSLRAVLGEVARVAIRSASELQSGNGITRPDR